MQIAQFFFPFRWRWSIALAVLNGSLQVDNHWQMNCHDSLSLGAIHLQNFILGWPSAMT
jgi:hypothetical protein